MRTPGGRKLGRTCASVVVFAAGLAASEAWAQPASTDAQPPVQRPKSQSGTQPAATSTPEAPTAPTEPGEPTPAEEPAAAPLEPPSAAEPESPSPELAPELLAPSEPEAAAAPTPAPAPAAAADDDLEEGDPYAALTASYRPRHNPTRFNLVTHALFANVGSKDGSLNGRLGGVSVDAGQSWNVMGYALTFGVLGGAITVGNGNGVASVLVGGGPTLTLGRLAMVGRGFADLRLGYDFFYAPVHRLETDPTVEVPDILAPHGPRVRLDLGLVGPGNRRFWHGFGISIGYQALVGSLRNEMPFTNMLYAGLVYWMG